MDKLSTEWRPLSITTTFRIRTQNDQPVICASPRSERSYTEPCGLGWRFAIFYSHYSQSIMFEYDSHYAHRGLGTLQVTLTLCGENTPEGEYVMREMRPAEPEKRTPIAAWPASAFVQHRLLAFKVDLREPIDVPPPTSLAPSIRQALGDSTRTGTFIDTRFFVYSRRAPSGRVWHPLPLYANGVLLGEKSDYMNTLLNVQGFAESTPGDISTAFPADGNPFTDTYEYASDSDLDDEDDSAADLAADRTLLRRNTVPTQEARLIVRTPATAHPMTAGDRPSSTSSTTSSSTVPLGPIPLELSGRTIHVKDIAFKTWQSLVFYLYTGDVSFLPLRSDRTRSRAEMTEQHLADHPHDPPPCSPKSMYRCAEKLGLEELERLAFQAIRLGLNEKNILQEVFSRFTSKYPVISEMQTDLLVREHYDSPAVAHAFAEIMGPVAEGELPHSGPVLTSIFERLAKRGRGAGSGI